jgi:predicted glycosyltransferase
MRIPPLDVLLYAHDGRGVGHVSRSAAVGLALRRLYPASRVLLASGSREIAAMSGPGRLDWLKLPAYATRVVDGESRGVDGPSGFEDAALGVIRSKLLADVVHTLRPRLVLADHTPQGKHSELLPALEASCAHGTLWALGVRAVVGEVGKVWSPLAAEIFSGHYQELLWYGDASVLGSEAPAALARHFGREPVATGYVSRLAELLAQEGGAAATGRSGGTAAISWTDGASVGVLSALAEALGRLGGAAGPWRVFVGSAGPKEARAAAEPFAGMTFVRVEPFGPDYLESLGASRAAVVYGGYNSLTDVLAANVPAVVLTRGMQDKEQEEHVRRLAAATGLVRPLAEAELNGAELASVLAERLAFRAQPARLDLDGAANAAHHLARRIGL